MSPFHRLGGQKLATQTKLKFINHVVCFSSYTKKIIDQEYKTKSQLIYPAVTLPSRGTQKKKVILSVGRFTQNLHHKRQDALISAFSDMESQLPDWRLILAGGTEKGSSQLLSSLKKKSANHRITIKTDISHSELTQLYSQSSLYWHAAGFGADLVSHPEKAEHFGISIVEAMGASCVPLVFNAGGPREIVTQTSGAKWSTLDELKKLTLSFAQNTSKRKQFAQKANKRAKSFNKSRFCSKFNDLVKN